MLKGNIENVMNFCIHSRSFKNLVKRKKNNIRKGMEREAALIMKKHESFGSKLKFVTNVDFLWVLYAVCLVRGCGMVMDLMFW